MKLYHCHDEPTTPDASGIYFADTPFIFQAGTIVVFDAPEEEVEQYELVKPGQAFREFAIPTAVAGGFPIVRVTTRQQIREEAGPIVPTEEDREFIGRLGDRERARRNMIEMQEEWRAEWLERVADIVDPDKPPLTPEDRERMEWLKIMLGARIEPPSTD